MRTPGERVAALLRARTVAGARGRLDNPARSAMERHGAAREESDGAMVRRVVAGDVDAFELLVDRHAPRVRRLVARGVPRAAADEVAHNAFVAAYLSLASYVETHPFEHWLVRIALRACSDYWRARGRDERAGGTAELADAAAAPAPADDDRELCEWALARLAREDREVLMLVYFEELSVKECAEVLSWSESKVKVRAHRARARLRRILRRALPERWRP
jgi:RNA polymerase sigma-70 factor (ECF subfamily)